MRYSSEILNVFLEIHSINDYDIYVNAISNFNMEVKINRNKDNLLFSTHTKNSHKRFVIPWLLMMTDRQTEEEEEEDKSILGAENRHFI